MAIETVIFDFDGFVADTKKLMIDCGKEVLNKHGYPIPSEEQIEELRALDLKEVLRHHLGIKWRDVLPLYFEGRALFKSRHVAGQIKPYPGMLEVIENLRKDNYTVLICSSNEPQIIEDSFKNWKVECPQIYHAPNVFFKHPGLYRIIHERGLTRKKDTIIYGGDELRDYYACKFFKIKMRAGMWGLNNEKAFMKQRGFNREDLVFTPAEFEVRARAA